MEELVTRVKQYLRESEKTKFNLGEPLSNNILLYDGFRYTRELGQIVNYILSLEIFSKFEFLVWARENKIEEFKGEELFNRDIEFYLRYLYCLFRKEKFVEGAIAGVENNGILDIIFLSILKHFEYNNHYWKNLSHLELGKFSEYYAKMEFLKNGFQVYQTEVDDRGIDFAITVKDSFLEIQVKSIRLKTSSYIFFTKTEKFFVRKSLYVCLVLFTEDLNPQLYLIPSLELNKENGLFVFRKYGDEKHTSKPEWGINLSKKHLSKLKRYVIDLAIIRLKI